MAVDKYYQRCLKEITLLGSKINSRNSVTFRSTNQVVNFDKTPLISVRRTAWKSALREMEWFLSGSTNINHLHSSVRKWWEPWADENGVVKNNYSKQFRRFGGETDQLEVFIEGIKNDPFSRRNLITMWNTTDMINPETPITNCHGSLIMAAVEPDNTLHLTMVQRSADMMLGVPHNWIQYWAFLLFLSHKTGLLVGSLTWIGHDCHIYEDHVKMADKVLKTGVSDIEDLELVYTPTCKDFKASDFSLKGEYNPIIKESLRMIV